jgi:hypothetical protein
MNHQVWEPCEGEWPRERKMAGQCLGIPVLGKFAWLRGVVVEIGGGREQKWVGLWCE